MIGGSCLCRAVVSAAQRYYPEKRSKQLPLPQRNLWSTLHDAASSTAIIELKRKIMLGSWVTLGR